MDMQPAFRVTEDRFPGLVRTVRDMDDADTVFKRAFKGREIATRREFAPIGFRNRVRWMLDKIMAREALL